MGRYMIPVCVICGKRAETWHNAEWEAAGGLQDICPEHAKEIGEVIEYHRASDEQDECRLS